VTAQRLSALRQALRSRELDRALITSPEHVRYLSGFSGSSAWLVVAADEQILVTDFRYRDQAAKEATGWAVHVATNGLSGAVRELVQRQGSGRVGYEGAHLTVRDYRLLSAPPGDGESSVAVDWVETERLVESLMVVKEEREIDLIRRSAEITDRLFSETVAMVRVGMSERELAMEIEYRARQLGADRMAFPPIIASGPDAALPHAQPGERTIERGDMIIIDCGVSYCGYASDLTRTVAVGSASDRLREIYAIVLEAEMAALGVVRPGVTGVDLDRVARSLIEAKGYGEGFGHPLGHGLGLRVHDAPSISWRSQDTLAPGMVFTIEPGIYLPGWGGVRIEDLVVVREDGKEILSRASKELVVL